MNHRYFRVDDGAAQEILRRGGAPIAFMRTSLSGVVLLALAASAAAADLAVTIENVGGAGGNVRVGLFANGQTFPGNPDRGETVPAAPGGVTVVFRDLQPGNYAVSAFHDLNANNKLDTGLFGRPAEPLGFSRDARARMGPPSFDDAAFAVDGAAAKIAVRLRP